jgi:hypothetical protein
MKVFTKARKWSPSVETKYSVEIVHNKSIDIVIDDNVVNSFKIGDSAEYDSYNLIYTGAITKITDKMVQVTAYIGSRNERKHNLDLSTFCWRNEKFDAVKISKHNFEEMQYI